jgi:hypothetical protein
MYSGKIAMPPGGGGLVFIIQGFFEVEAFLVTRYTIHYS